MEAASVHHPFQGSRVVALGALCALGFGLMAGPASAKDRPGFRVIVHSGRTGNAIRRVHLHDIFLKRVTQWSDGSPITPVDQSTRWRVRASFSLNVLALPVSSVQTYWERQMVVSREQPPLVFGSDEEVIAFVSTTPGAIGYVSRNATIDGTVKVLSIVG